MDHHCFHWRFVPTTVPVDVGQDKVEGDIPDEVPEEESDADACFQKVGQHQRDGRKVQNFEADGMLPVVESTGGISGVEKNPHA